MNTDSHPTHKPKERVDRVILLFAQIVKAAGWKMDIAGVTANAFSSLADVVLALSVIDTMRVSQDKNTPLSSSIARHRQTWSLAQ
jgi:hypothetical protein